MDESSSGRRDDHQSRRQRWRRRGRPPRGRVSDIHSLSSLYLDGNPAQPRSQAPPNRRAGPRRARNRRRAAKRKEGGVKSEGNLSADNEDESVVIDEMSAGNAHGNVTELAASLTEKLNAGKMECIICYERIKRGKPLWSCETCYAILHLHCAVKWARRSENALFRCPGCRTEHRMTGKNNNQLECRCFCGKVRNPSSEPGVTPGSCGDTCLKGRGEPGSDCPHNCVLLCHPGPCPPCLVAGSPVACHCGRKDIPRRCGEPKLSGARLSCGTVCERFLPCGHLCGKICSRECGPCLELVEVGCFCGKKTSELACEYIERDLVSSGAFACESVCGKALECGNHFCESVCHKGTCGRCAKSPAQADKCSCGSRRLTKEERAARTSCRDPIPSCGAICSKPTGCVAKHKCTLICGHEGQCKSSSSSFKALCRCGTTVVSLNCTDTKVDLIKSLVCSKVCNDKLSCKKHRCKRRCCALKSRKPRKRGQDVDTTLGSLLWNERAASPSDHADNSCELSQAPVEDLSHRCERLCDELLNCGLHRCDLHCGHVITCPPCGILIRQPLTCSCGAQRLEPPLRCGHPLPPCDLPCTRERPCGHPCPERCHPNECPICCVLVRRTCVGGHGESRIVPCHVGEIRCSRNCGRPLACGVHVCRRGCHKEGLCEEVDLNTGCCTQLCGLPRPCCHPCDSACHKGEPCPQVLCQHPVKVYCPCGRREGESRCLTLSSDASPLITDDGRRIEIPCDEECARQQRLKGFASAIRGSEGNLEQEEARYPEFLIRFAGTDGHVLNIFEKELGSIVQGNARKIELDELPNLHRHALHTLAEFYNLETCSVGKYPNRRVLVHHRGPGFKPYTPNPLLSEAYKKFAQEQRLNRISLSRRSLRIRFSRDVSYSKGELNTHVRVALRSHAGYFRVKEIPGEKFDGSTIIEFSTTERMRAAKATLHPRTDLICEDISADWEHSHFRKPQGRTSEALSSWMEDNDDGQRETTERSANITTVYKSLESLESNQTEKTVSNVEQAEMLEWDAEENDM